MMKSLPCQSFPSTSSVRGGVAYIQMTRRSSRGSMGKKLKRGDSCVSVEIDISLEDLRAAADIEHVILEEILVCFDC